MLPLDDPRWQSYTGGYREPYDASMPLRQLLDVGASPELWDELWQELHHQGSVGPASFAAVPWLLEFTRRSRKMDWNAFGLIAVIEFERPNYCRNWPIPPELVESYTAALAQLPLVVGSHAQREWPVILMQHIMACIALVVHCSSIVEEIAQAYFDALQQRKKQSDDEWINMAQAERGRAAKILTLVLDAFTSHAADHEAALTIVQQFVAQFCDWSDEVIANRVCAGMDHALHHEVKESPAYRGLDHPKASLNVCSITRFSFSPEVRGPHSS